MIALSNGDALFWSAVLLACAVGCGAPAEKTEGPAGAETAPVASGTPSAPVATGDVPSAEPSAAPVSDGSFTLLFRDDFTTLDTTKWQLMTHSWGGNLALFSAQAVTIEDGTMVLRLLPAPEGTVDSGEAKSFLGAEVRSRQTLTYGRVKTRAKFASGSAVVSALVTIYTPWPADNWNELDIEALGADPSQVQFNAQVYTGPATQAPVTTPVSPTQDPYMETLGFDASLDFHEYAIEWTPAGASFSVDSEVRYTWTDNIALMNLPQNVLMTIWASGSPGWAGAVTEQTTGATAVYDWVELWTYDGATTTPATSMSIASGVAPQVIASGGAPSAGASSTDGGAAGTAVGSGGIGGTLNVGGQVAAGGNLNTAGAPSDDEFVLLFRDDFDGWDADRWQIMTHSWDTNLALFSAESVVVQGGFMALTLLDAPPGTTDDTGAAKSFLGAEVRSYETIEYGRVRARMRLAEGSAVVSALVTIYTPWPADDWNELDIEALGADTTHVQFNTMVYTGAPPPTPVTASVTPTQHPQLVDLGFDGSADYHEYTIEWTPEQARFLVDDVVLHSWSERIDLMGLPQNVLLTIWASSSPEWAGAVTASTSGSTASYDWVEVYEYQP